MRSVGSSFNFDRAPPAVKSWSSGVSDNISNMNEEAVRFSPEFIFGVSTSAYQIEGAFRDDGKGLSVWDTFVRRPGVIDAGDTGDRACDHYHRYRGDAALIGALGVDAYRFSVSWSRVLPDGTGRVNEAGLDFYDRLVDELAAAGLRPFVTLFHWDLPQALEERGGWTNRDAASWFAEYADLLARRLGDRVDHWITLNEPLSVVGAGYLAGVHAPGHRSLIKAVKATHTMLLAHAMGSEAIRAGDPGAIVGIANSFSPVYPARRKDARVARRIGQVLNQLFMDPFYFRRYPPFLAPVIHLLNRHIRPGDWKQIAVPPDFVGVNHYSRYIAKRTLLPFIGFRVLRPVYERIVFTDMDWEVYPPGFRRILAWIANRYGNPPVIVTENGASFDEPVSERRIDDQRRISYLRDYLLQMHAAIQAGCAVKGYFVWSLLDNFEWQHGYQQRFGIVHVDYRTLERIPKASYHFYQRVVATRSVAATRDVAGAR